MAFTLAIPPNTSGFLATAFAIIVALVWRRPWKVARN